MFCRGVLAALTLGVDGSDLIVGDGLEIVDFVVGVALAATRGVIGVRTRLEARVGLSGRFVLLDRSVDIRPVFAPSPVLSSSRTCLIAPVTNRVVQLSPHQWA